MKTYTPHTCTSNDRCISTHKEWIMCHLILCGTLTAIHNYMYSNETRERIICHLMRNTPKHTPYPCEPYLWRQKGSPPIVHTLQQTAARTATHCNTLHHTTTDCNTLYSCSPYLWCREAAQPIVHTLQHTATHAATQCNIPYPFWPCLWYQGAAPPTAHTGPKDSQTRPLLESQHAPARCCWLLQHSVVQCVVVWCNVLQCVAVCGTTWVAAPAECFSVCCGVLQRAVCVACCSSIVWCNLLQRVAVCCSVLQCVAVCCSVLQCVAVCCSVLQCVAVCCSVCCSAWDSCAISHLCVAVCCSALVCCSVLQCVAVCCSVLQGVAWCCSVLQCVAVYQVVINQMVEAARHNIR